jgi:hypothetical protein
VPTADSSGEWWSWPKVGSGFAVPLVIYAIWGAYVYFGYRHLEANRPPDATEDGGAMYVFLMIVVFVLLAAVLLIVGAALCIVRSARAVGMGIVIAALLPIAAASAYYLWTSIRLGALTRKT